MRKLMWFTIGFAAACIVGAYLLSALWLLILCGFCLVALFGVVAIPSIHNRAVICTLLGCVVGLTWWLGFDRLYLQPVRRLDEQIVTLQIEITDYSKTTAYGVSAEGKTKLNGKPYRLRFYLREEAELLPGDILESDFQIRYTGSGAVSPTYHQGKGIFLLAYAKSDSVIEHQQKVPVRHFAANLRHKILSLLDVVFPDDTAPFAKALLVGQTDELSFDTVTALKTSGVYHIVAVSGMHVSILVSLVCILFSYHRIISAVVCIPVLFVFAMVAGLSPSIVRATIMHSLVLLSLATDREYDPPTALAAGVLPLLVTNPLSITSVSLQLSVGCMLGILFFTQRIHDYLLKKTPLGPAKGNSRKAKLTRWAVASVSVTVGAMLTTTPLCAAYFGSISIIGLLTNLLLLWSISIIFYGIVAACLLGILWLPLGIAVGWVLSWPIRIILWVTDMISRVPVASVYTSSIYIVAWLIFAYILITVFLKCKKKHPWILSSCLIFSLAGAVLFSWLEPRLDDFRFTAVDVGQGQCLILQNDGKFYMVDCGGDTGDQAADKASQLLLSQGIFRLDGLILTHYDEDHAGGADQLLSRIPADTIYMPVVNGDNKLRDELSHKYSDKIHWVEDTLPLNDVEITIYPSDNRSDANESSLCILFQPEDYDILITGDRSFDGETELMNQVTLPDLEILVAGHHGSKTSTSWDLLNATRPDVAIISVGANNRYGHPTWETLERLRLFGCGVYRTDLEGTIIFRG